MPSTNMRMLQTVAEGISALTKEVVFVGGAIAELYATNPALADIRPTQDVDCVIELNSRKEHADLEAELRKLGFAHDTSKDAPICRYIYKDIKVDVMPTNPDILGFSNIWYTAGIKTSITKTLENKTEILIFRPPMYLAAKLEAHKGRGGDDLRQSHDFEDFIYVLNNCKTILEEIKNSSKEVKEYLKTECQNLLNNKGLTEGIECALPYGTGEEHVEIIFKKLRIIAK